MELSILITMVVSLVGCLAAALMLAGLVTIILLLTGRGVRRSVNNGILLGFVPLVTPAFMMACNLGFFLPTFEVIREGLSTTGTVVGYDESSDDGGTTYSSIVEFTTGAGQTVRFSDTAVSSNPPRHSIGQQVGVIYMEDQPERAVISDPFWWAIPALLFVVSLITLPIGYFLAWRGFRRGDVSILGALADTA